MKAQEKSLAPTKNELQIVTLNDNRFAVEERSGNISFNLTMMAKPYGTSKRPNQWLRTDEAKRYLEEMSKVQKSSLADLLEVRKGGTPGLTGTWAYDYRIAVRFAQWLDVKFAVAVDELIYKLLTKQATVSEPFMGVSPLIVGHKAYYCYLDVLKALKLSTSSGYVYKRKQLYPNQFVKLYNRNFITLDFCHYLHKKSNIRQLELDFKQSLLTEGGAI